MRNPISILRLTSVLACALIVAAGSPFAASDKSKPSLSLKASPMTGFAPTRVVLTAEVKGGADDYPEYYCPTVEWVWGDDTKAESKIDCEPYEAGKSEIRRRYSIQHKYNIAGVYDVRFSLKQRDKTVVSARTKVIVREGMAP